MWDDLCNFFGSLSVSGRKKGGVKTKSNKNSRFLCVFWKIAKFWPTLKPSKFVFFYHRNAQTNPQHSFQQISNTFGVKIPYPDNILVFLQHLWKTNYFLRKIEIFFSRDLLLFLKTIVFVFFCFFGKICHFMKKKKNGPLLSSWTYLPILSQKWF